MSRKFKENPGLIVVLIGLFITIVPCSIGIARILYLQMYVENFHYQKEREVYFVNGLSRSYTIQFSDGSPDLRVRSEDVATAIISKEGVTISIISDKYEISDLKLESETLNYEGFLVCNPDRSALMRQRRIDYGGAKTDVMNFNSQYFIGSPVYNFGEIDYKLEKAPETIQMLQFDRSEERTEVIMLDYLDYETVDMSIFEDQNVDPFRQALDYREEFDPLEIKDAGSTARLIYN